MTENRFVEYGPTTQWFFHHPIDVRCPECLAHAQIVLSGDPSSERRPGAGRGRRFICTGCNRTQENDPSERGFKYPTGRDPYFQHELWLRKTLSPGLLWAFNIEHLRVLRRIVSADIRERGFTDRTASATTMSRLPKWVKLAKNRTMVLRALDDMEASLEQ